MEKKLHILRIREKGDDSFYDPQADIRGILPNVVSIALAHFWDKASEEERKDIDYLLACFRIFQIRLLEDRTPLTEQLKLFDEAVKKVNPVRLMRIRDALVNTTLTIYALLMRRDQPMRGRDFNKMVNDTSLLQLKKKLSPEHYKQVCEWLKEEEDPDDSQPLSDNSMAWCEETGETYNRLRQLACKLLNVSGTESWDEIAELCDKQFDATGLGNAESIALALAYPTYKNLALTAELEEDNEK